MDTTNVIEAREFITKAREALKNGDKESARDWGEKAALLAPDLEDAWLVLTAADSNPEDALAYAQKALELNPSLDKARIALFAAFLRQGDRNSAAAQIEIFRKMKKIAVVQALEGRMKKPVPAS